MNLSVSNETDIQNMQCQCSYFSKSSKRDSVASSNSVVASGETSRFLDRHVFASGISLLCALFPNTLCAHFLNNSRMT